MTLTEPHTFFVSIPMEAEPISVPPMNQMESGIFTVALA
jgi:hypothetical protein